MVESLVKSKEEESKCFDSLRETVEELKMKLNSSTIPKKNEAYYQQILVNMGYGDHEIYSLGISDITGPDTHIEIKNWKDWIKASGQLDVYNFCLPKQFNAVYFFGEPPKSKKLKDITTFLKSKRVKMFSFHTIDDSITDHWIDDTEDHLRTFFQETIEKSENNDDFVQISELKRLYDKWFNQKGLNTKLKDLAKFYNFLAFPENLGPKPSKTTISKRDINGNPIFGSNGIRERIHVNGWRGWTISYIHK